MRNTKSAIRIGIIGICLFILAACQSGLERTTAAIDADSRIEPIPTPSRIPVEMSPPTSDESRVLFEGIIAFYSDMAGNPDIYVIRADGHGLKQLTDDSAYDDSPDLSSDGQRVVFLSARNDPDPQFPDLKYDIYVINVDGTGLSQLTATEVGEDHPSWSPDGARILFDADYDADGFYEIYSMGADGTDLNRLTYGSQNDQFGEWSPDGEKIAFSSDRNGNWDIFVMEADGSDPMALTDDDNWQLFPAWSPDGLWLAYTGLAPGSRNTDVFIMGSNGSDKDQLTSESGFDENPAWSPDGEWVVYQHQEGGIFELYLVNLAGTVNKSLITLPSNCLWPSWGISSMP